MCFDERTSWITFLIGTSVNLWLVKKNWNNKSIIGVSFFWQFVLLIQLFEALVWRSHRLNEPQNCIKATNAILIATLAQPMLFTLAASYTSGKWVLGAFIAAAYGLYAMWAATHLKTDKCVTATQECPHLAFDWVADVPGGSIPYFATAIVAVLLLMSPMKLKFAVIGYLGITAAISAKIYPCASASIWCWFGAFAPVFTGLVLRAF